YGGSDSDANLTLDVIDPNHISTKNLPNPWTIFDEYYVFNQDPTVVPGIKALLRLELTNIPYEWYHDYDGGRAWYTNGGSVAAVWSDSNFLENILGGIEYARGLGGDTPATAGVTPPPANLNAAAGDTSASLTWSPSEGATSYNVYP